MKHKILTIMLILFSIHMIYGFTSNTSGTPSSSQQEHHVFIGFNPDRTSAQCMEIISKFSGTIIQTLKEFNFPVYLVKIKHALPPVSFEKKVLTEMKRQNGVRFVSLERNTMKESSLMEIESTSIQRQGGISISAPKNTKYDAIKKSASKNAYMDIVENHRPGLKSVLGGRQIQSSSKNLYAIIEMEIDSEGEVSQVRIKENNISSSEIRQRLKDKIYGWKDFPRRASSDLVTVRFKFNAQ